MSYQPIIIIGAPRSGTNMLRDVLCELGGIGTWPCDEINYIWRHGNIEEKTEEFDRALATLKVKNYIRNEIDDFAKKQNLDIVIEKTCANSYRVPFVDEVLPEAKYIFIYRDGVDVVGSSAVRWKASLDIPYLLKKVRYVPLSDLFYYAYKYLGSHVYRLFSKEERLSFWGPKFKGFKEAQEKYSLEEVCSLQWKASVDLSEKAFANMPSDKVSRVSYESFVSRPNEELKRILNELNVNFNEAAVDLATKNVSSRSIGKGRKALDDNKLKEVSTLISDSLERYGYE